MDRVLLAVGLAVVVIAVALVLQRRRRNDAPTQPTGGFEAPAQVDRADFVRPDAPWLVVTFTSSTCSTCAEVWSKARLLESDMVAVQEVEVGTDPDLHARYVIEAVPITIVVDAEGVVRSSFLGPVSSTHLWAALAELREPGSVPPGCQDDISDESPEPSSPPRERPEPSAGPVTLPDSER